jgi:hypothetical protein
VPTLRPGARHSSYRPETQTREGSGWGDGTRTRLSPRVLVALLSGAAVVGGCAAAGALLLAGTL